MSSGKTKGKLSQEGIETVLACIVQTVAPNSDFLSRSLNSKVIDPGQSMGLKTEPGLSQMFRDSWQLYDGVFTLVMYIGRRFHFCVSSWVTVPCGNRVVRKLVHEISYCSSLVAKISDTVHSYIFMYNVR